MADHSDRSREPHQERIEKKEPPAPLYPSEVEEEDWAPKDEREVLEPRGAPGVYQGRFRKGPPHGALRATYMKHKPGVTKMPVTVSTTEYQFAHGKQPRGTGQWAFFFDKNPEPMWSTGSFAQAKKFAVAWAVAKGYTTVKVGS